MMKARYIPVLAALMIGVGSVAISAAATAGSDSADKQRVFQQACSEQGARFQQTWRYNDQGTQWGPVFTCVMPVGQITCEGESCAARQSSASAGSRKVAEFPAEPAIFTSVLAYLAAK
jgi:hypothetical protein